MTNGITVAVVALTDDTWAVDALADDTWAGNTWAVDGWPTDGWTTTLSPVQMLRPGVHIELHAL